MASNTKVSPIEVQKILSGFDFPASKQDLIKYAKKKNASNDVINALNGMPDRSYTNSADVSSELGGNMDVDEKESDMDMD